MSKWQKHQRLSHLCKCSGQKGSLETGIKNGHMQPFIMTQRDGQYPAHSNPIRRKCQTTVFQHKHFGGVNSYISLTRGHLPWLFPTEGDIYIFLFPTDSNRNKILDFLNITSSSNTTPLREDECRCSDEHEYRRIPLNTLRRIYYIRLRSKLWNVLVSLYVSLYI